MEATTNDDDAKERVFGKSYNACVTFYVPTVNSSYIEIHSGLFSEYVEDELGKICDSYIAELSKDYSQLNKISAKGQELNVEMLPTTRNCIDLCFSYVLYIYVKLSRLITIK